MITYEQLMQKRNKLKKALSQNVDVLGVNLYVDMINDLEQIYFNLLGGDCEYQDIMDRYNNFEEKLNNKLSDLAFGNNM